MIRIRVATNHIITSHLVNIATAFKSPLATSGPVGPPHPLANGQCPPHVTRLRLATTAESLLIPVSESPFDTTTPESQYAATSESPLSNARDIRVTANHSILVATSSSIRIASYDHRTLVCPCCKVRNQICIAILYSIQPTVVIKALLGVVTQARTVS